MDFWEAIWEAIKQIWGTVFQHLGYIRELNNNITTLMKETGKLKRKRDEVEDEVNVAESVGKKRRCDVGDWLQDVDEIVAEVGSIQSEFDRGKTNVLSRHQSGKRVVEKIEVVKTLQDKGRFDEVAKSPRRLEMQKMQIPTKLEQQSTSQETLREIEEALSDKEIGVVCVCGMGGIGKTTLMKKICNRLTGTRDFHRVVWLTVSQDLNLNAIQHKLGNKLGVQFPDNEDVEDKRDRLYARLRNVKYMLILDDLWEAFSLDQVGIPQPDTENGCKIAITTRLINVSSEMEAHNEIQTKTIRMKTLTSEEAWDLFRSKTGDVVLLPKIRPVAEEVVKECGGLPLAIQTVGAAMHRKDKKELWENALRSLKGSAPEVRGMERQVFLPLKLSYDCLEDSSTKICFLYCSLYPEDYDIDVEDLARYWAFEEGLIDNVNSLDEALNKGHSIVERLKDACLLDEADEAHLSPHVRMHDLLRDLAIWITSPSSLSSFQASKFLVKAGEGLEQPPEEKMWEGMGRISLMSNEIKDLQITPNCPDLVSLFLCRNRKLHTIHTKFFHLMPKLQILDLRSTLIRSLPPSLSQLVNLRALILCHSSSLVEMPPLGELQELQLLDLQATGIKDLPEGISNLVKLKQLNLSLTDALTMIPSNLISKLTCLEDLRLWGKAQMHVAAWREVATLTRLSYLTINLSKLDNFGEGDMHHLQSLSNLKQFLVCFGGDSSFNLKQTEKDLHIVGCCNFPRGIEGLISHVKSLKLSRCEAPECLSPIVGYSKSLIMIEVTFSNGVRCIIDWREMQDVDALNCLQMLYLRHLDFMERVFDGGSSLPPTHFQQLQRVDIASCPKLRCVFSSSMVNHLNQLTWLHIKDCKEMEEIVQGDKLPDNALQRLSYLCLICLPRLTSICRHGLTLTALERINVEGCPELKKLPVLRSSLQKISGEVKGKKEWWDGIEWEDDNSKLLYSTIYAEIEPGGGGEASKHEPEVEEKRTVDGKEWEDDSKSIDSTIQSTSKRKKTSHSFP